MTSKYKEQKVTQAAARLLRQDGGRMPYMKLIKLLYLADRTALLRWGQPISYDLYYSLPHGPVLSLTLDKINSGPDSNEKSYWYDHISAPDGYDVELLADVEGDQLSPAEEELIDEIFGAFGHMNQWELRDLLHEYPEWQDPEGSSIPISIRDIFRAEGIAEETIDEIEEALEADATAERLLA